MVNLQNNTGLNQMRELLMWTEEDHIQDLCDAIR